MARASLLIPFSGSGQEGMTSWLRAYLRQIPVLKQLRSWQRWTWRRDHLQANQHELARQLMGQPQPTLPDDPQFGTTTCICRERDFRTALYQRWCAEMQEPPSFRRKQWENVYLLTALERSGCLQPGFRALGFGCGRELMPSLLAARGLSVVATDQAASSAQHGGWIEYEQHAAGLDALLHAAVIDKARFTELVRFQTADMNAIPNDLRNFDVVWSTCALEHLGSIAHAVRFIEASLACLKPGGVAVHTFEFNGGDQRHTIERGLTVLLRHSDLEALEQRLSAQGHTMAPIDVVPGDGFVDRWIDLPPYRQDLWPRLSLERHIAVSAGIMIRREQN